jgi:hypothetical protein
MGNNMAILKQFMSRFPNAKVLAILQQNLLDLKKDGTFHLYFLFCCRREKGSAISKLKLEVARLMNPFCSLFPPLPFAFMPGFVGGYYVLPTLFRSVISALFGRPTRIRHEDADGDTFATREAAGEEYDSKRQCQDS